MNHAPHQPGGQAREAQETELRHGLCAPNGRQHASICIDKRLALLRRNTLTNELGDIAALLHGNGGYPRQSAPSLVGTMRGIADDKNPGVTRDRQVSLNLDPTGPILWNSERSEKRRRLVARRPNDTRGPNEFVSDHQALGADLAHRAVKFDRDTLSFERHHRFS